MKKGSNSSSIWIIGIVVVTGVIAVFIYANRKDQATEDQIDPNQTSAPGMVQETGYSPSPGTPTQAGPQTSGAAGTSQTDNSLTDTIKGTVKDLTTARLPLQDIVTAAKTWMPSDCHEKWIGKAAPDFSALDISGRQHKLSDYRGKNVIIALFAPSFAPSLPELRKLAQLQGVVGQDELVVLGLSFDAEGAVRRYMEGQPSISYPVIAGAQQDIPAPYSEGKPMPCAMFINPEGVLKLSTRGSLPAEDAKAILAARI
jgi:peroxiredoxin